MIACDYYYSTSGTQPDYDNTGTAATSNTGVIVVEDATVSSYIPTCIEIEPPPEVIDVKNKYSRDKNIQYSSQRFIDYPLFHRQLMDDSPGQCSPANWRKRGMKC
jgi:hypothetical protein